MRKPIVTGALTALLLAAAAAISQDAAEPESDESVKSASEEPPAAAPEASSLPEPGALDYESCEQISEDKSVSFPIDL